MTSLIPHLSQAAPRRTRRLAVVHSGLLRSVPRVFSGSLMLFSCTDNGIEPQQTPTATVTVSSPSNDGQTPRDLPSDVVSGTEALFNGMPPEIRVSDASAEVDVSDARLQTCIPSKGPGEVLLIDDFEDGDEVLEEREGRSGIWYQYEEIAGDHQLAFETLGNQRLDSTGALHTTSSGHGEWAGVGLVLSACVYDASSYVGVHFWIRGTSSPVDVALVTPGVIPVSGGGTCTKDAEGLCYDAYRSRVTVSEQWQEVFVPFTSFEQNGYGVDAGPLDLTRLESIQFQSQPSAFDLWIDDLSFYVEEVYTPFDASVPSTEPDPSGDTTTSGSTTSDDTTSNGTLSDDATSAPATTSVTPSSEPTTSAPASTGDGGSP